MEYFVAVFFVAVLALAIVGMLYASSQANARADTYTRLATRFRGRAKRGDLFSTSSATFEHRGASVLVNTHNTGGDDSPHYTQVHLDWPDSGLRSEFYPPSFFARLGSFFGVEDIEIGASGFDDYYISGNDRSAIRQSL